MLFSSNQPLTNRSNPQKPWTDRSDRSFITPFNKKSQPTIVAGSFFGWTMASLHSEGTMAIRFSAGSQLEEVNWWTGIWLNIFGTTAMEANGMGHIGEASRNQFPVTQKQWNLCRLSNCTKNGTWSLPTVSKKNKLQTSYHCPLNSQLSHRNTTTNTLQGSIFSVFRVDPVGGSFILPFLIHRKGSGPVSLCHHLKQRNWRWSAPHVPGSNGWMERPGSCVHVFWGNLTCGIGASFFNHLYSFLHCHIIFHHLTSSDVILCHGSSSYILQHPTLQPSYNHIILQHATSSTIQVILLLLSTSHSAQPSPAGLVEDMACQTKIWLAVRNMGYSNSSLQSLGK